MANRKVLVLSLVLVGLFMLNSIGLTAEWPTRPITIAVFSAAGGGTDLVNRTLASIMERELNTKITVVNMPGASGGVAANYVYSRPRDGYNWLGCSEGILPVAVLGAHPTTSRDWEYFIVGGTPGVLSVREDSPFETVEDVIKAMKENPGQIKLAASQAGCIWHMKALLIREAAGVEFKFIPYQGSNPSQLAALSGEVDVVVTGLGEQAEFLVAKKLRALAAVELEDLVIPGVGRVPSIVKAIPEMKEKLPLDQFLGFAVPSDTPKHILDKITEAFKKAVQSQEMKDFAEIKYLRISGLYGQEAKQMVASMEKIFSWSLYDLGMAQKSPAEFSIDRP